MCEIKISFDQVEKAISVMREAQIRWDGYDKAGYRGDPGRVPQSRCSVYPAGHRSGGEDRQEDLSVRRHKIVDRMSISGGRHEADTRICRYKA